MGGGEEEVEVRVLDVFCQIFGLLFSPVAWAFEILFVRLSFGEGSGGCAAKEVKVEVWHGEGRLGARALRSWSLDTQREKDAGHEGKQKHKHPSGSAIVRGGSATTGRTPSLETGSHGAVVRSGGGLAVERDRPRKHRGRRSRQRFPTSSRSKRNRHSFPVRVHRWSFRGSGEEDNRVLPSRAR